MSMKCWSEGVFVDRALLTGTIGLNVISPGVGSTLGDSPTIVHQAYYQWIFPLLAIQAFILYLPRGIWRIWENGLMKKLMGMMEMSKEQEVTILKFYN